MAFQSATEVVDALIHAYYNGRDIEAALACVTEDVEWVGTENDDSAIGKEALRALLHADIQTFPEPCKVQLEEPRVRQLGPDAVLVCATGVQTIEYEESAEFVIRGTVCCVKTDEGWLIASIHVSVPNAEVEKVVLRHKLDAEREKIKTLLENIPGGVATFREKKDGSILLEYASEGLARLRGFESAEEMLEEMSGDVRRFLTPEDASHLEPILRGAEQNGAPLSAMFLAKRKNGEPLPLSIDATAVKSAELGADDAAVFYAVETILSGDTLRAKAEQDYYRAILDLTHTTYFEVDDKKNFYSSDSFHNYKVGEYGMAAVMGSAVAANCFHPDDLDKVKQYLHQVYLNGVAPSVIVRMAMTDGSYQWTELTGYAEFTKQHTISRMTGILRKENVEFEKQNESLKLALAEAKKANQAKTSFLSRVSHDMRTPLNGILGLATLLKDSITDPAALQDLNELEISGKYLLALINDTLDMSRIESGKLELHPVVCDGRMMFGNALRMAKLSVKGRKITFNIHTQKTPFTLLYVDVSRVEQIFMNVFGNAVKFTPDGGTIDFTMRNVSVKDGVIINKLMITDTGVGISREFLPHVFEPFSQADGSKTSTSQGTGLGMAITKRLIELMGGSISVESELGKGTTFTMILKLPMATPEQIKEWEKTKTISVADVNLEGKRVLLCEDHPLNTKVATRLLEAKGIKVEHAENGQIGVEMFKQSAPLHYDAILMDIRMPVLDGIEAAKAIRNLPRADAGIVPIIAMTANAFADDREQTRAAGMNGHLSKPIQTDMLYATLAEQMQLPRVVHKRKVLVVDDVEVNRAVIKASLSKEYEIFEAENGKRALEILREDGRIEAVITDIRMPEMDGIELIRQIRSDEKNRRMVIIANTQYGGPEQEEQLLALGANDFVYKPTAPKIVEIRIKNALRGL